MVNILSSSEGLRPYLQAVNTSLCVGLREGRIDGDFTHEDITWNPKYVRRERMEGIT